MLYQAHHALYGSQPIAAFRERAISTIASFYLYCSLNVKQG